ncbi:amidohydrolase family protein [Phytohabitans flavus]|uniref:Amidohydrolase n=1 Tax=Phytohabitans flavus TaxID=1076124 RepID=A0A6F8XRQ0_9ACTN|nr:amidohydrolase family protein [Phytohabitans flavus]BCB76503.1 amidohydrolase [Phytohabitans flavus]
MTVFPPGPVDLHQHAISTSYAERLTAIGVQAQPGIPFPTWDRARSLAAMDALGIAVAAVSTASPGYYFGDQDFTTALVRDTNDELADLVLGAGGRFLAFAAVPLPSAVAAVAEVQRLAGVAGFAGVSLLSNYGGRYLGDPAFDPLLAELDAMDAIVHVHPTLPPWWAEGAIQLRPSLLEYVFDTSRSLMNLMLSGAVDRYPRISWIFSHCGGVLPYISRRLEIAEPLPELARIDGVIATMARLRYDSALSGSGAGLGALLNVAPADRVVLGTDYPFVDEADVREELRRLDTFAEVGGVAGLGANARALLGLDTRSEITISRA